MSTAMGPARVLGSNPLKETVTVELETEVVVELPFDEVTFEAPVLKKGRKR